MTSAGTGKPIRWATVTIAASELGRNRSAITDDDGRYEFKSLPGGRYTVSASKETFIRLTYGQTRPSEPGRPLVLTAVQVADRIDFALPRGGVIAGRVFDEQGEAVVNVTVNALRPRYAEGRRQLISQTGSATTNDIGEFRIYGLQPGEYYVSATMRFPGGNVETPPSGFAPSFFPGTADVSQAQRVKVGIGETVQGTDIQMTPVRIARVTGIVSDIEGRPLANLNINLIQRGPATDQGVSFTTSAVDGSFSLSGIPPGQYSIDAREPRPMNVALGDSGTVIQPIVVDGADILGLRLTTTRMAAGTGRLLFDPPDAPAAARAVRISVTPADPSVFRWFAGQANVAQDMTFELEAPSGVLLVTAGLLPPGWMLKAVRVDDKDVTDSGIEFKPGAVVKGIEIELSGREPKLTGRVHDVAGRPVSDYSALVFSQNKDRRADRRGRYFAIVRPDQTGMFTVTGLPPGDYYAIAMSYVDQNEAASPELLESLEVDSVRLSLAEGDSKTLDLALASR